MFCTTCVSKHFLCNGLSIKKNDPVLSLLSISHNTPVSVSHQHGGRATEDTTYREVSVSEMLII